VKICPFCTLPAERILLQGKLALTIRDGFPVSPGHTLIITRRHVASFFELDDAEQSAMLALVNQSVKSLTEEFRPAGFNVGLNDRAAAGQTVPHVHIHVIPRFAGDQEDPRGGVRWIIPEKADYWSKR